MALAHVAEAMEIIRKRDEEREAAEKQRRAEAEALFQRCVMSPTAEKDVVKKLVQATDLLGLSWRDLEREGSLTEMLPSRLAELDELEVRYHEAVAAQAKLEADYRRQSIPEGDLREHRKKSHLRQAFEEVEHCKAQYGREQNLLKAHLGNSKYPRPLPARYNVSFEYLIENYHPARRDAQSGKVIPGEPRWVSSKLAQVEQEVGAES